MTALGALTVILHTHLPTYVWRGAGHTAKNGFTRPSAKVISLCYVASINCAPRASRSA